MSSQNILAFVLKVPSPTACYTGEWKLLPRQWILTGNSSPISIPAKNKKQTWIAWLEAECMNNELWLSCICSDVGLWARRILLAEHSDTFVVDPARGSKASEETSLPVRVGMSPWVAETNSMCKGNKCRWNVSFWAEKMQWLFYSGAYDRHFIQIWMLNRSVERYFLPPIFRHGLGHPVNSWFRISKKCSFISSLWNALPQDVTHWLSWL